jgi:hypothetical protein
MNFKSIKFLEEESITLIIKVITYIIILAYFFLVRVRHLFYYLSIFLIIPFLNLILLYFGFYLVVNLEIFLWLTRVFIHAS